MWIVKLCINNNIIYFNFEKWKVNNQRKREEKTKMTSISDTSKTKILRNMNY